MNRKEVWKPFFFQRKHTYRISAKTEEKDTSVLGLGYLVEQNLTNQVSGSLFSSFERFSFLARVEMKVAKLLKFGSSRECWML